MSIGGEIAKGAGALFKGLFLGILVVILFVAGLIMISLVVSAESPDIERHTDLELDAPTYILRDLESAIVAVEVALEMLDSTDDIDCEDINKTIHYRVKYMQGQIKRQPKVAHIYDGAIKYLLSALMDPESPECNR